MMDWFGDQGWPGLDYDMRMGLGGAMLFANSAAILTDAFPAEKRGMAMGFNMVAATAGSASSRSWCRAARR